MADEYNIDNGPDLQGLLQTVLGKQSDTDTKGNQTVTDKSTQASTGSSVVNSNQNTNQSTAGLQSTTGTTKTTGTQSQDSVQRSDADTSRLQEVYNKQIGGISADMLAAIFQQGSKAAPNLVTAQAGALGARGVGNTPMAQVLNQLNADLTSKAADVNRQLLGDAGTTAANIANLTKSLVNTGTTTSDQTAITDQDIVNSQSQVNAVTGTQSTDSSQNVVGDKVQNTVGAEQKKQATTINTSVAKSLAGLAAAGIGINELFKIATGKGFIGNLSEFTNYMRGLVTGGGSGGVASGAGGLSDLFPGVNLSDLLGDGGLTGSGNIISDLSDWTSGGPGWADGGLVEFLPVEQLIKSKKVLNEDADINSMLSSLFVGGSSGGNSGGSSSSGGSSNSSGEPADSGGASTTGGLQGGINSTPATAAQNAAAAQVASGLLGIVSGTPQGIAKGFISIANVINSIINSSAEADAQAGLNAANDSVGPAMGAGVAGGGSVGDSVGVGADGTDAGAGGSGSNGGNGGGDSSGVGGDSSSADGGTGSADGSAYADGGPIGKVNPRTGQISGPGTGISDSIFAIGPNGPIRVSNKEVIVPADVVEKKGTEFFEKLIENYHQPAALQRAAIGK